ncbi:M56 family metallopeptidase [Anaerotruncus rubiinfantis]|uniref:M56 family metallopeptidase n=1 Tax=Anaerotruncus rubiinfantis TaxID=1720200 RepID=UPI0034A1EE45
MTAFFFEKILPLTLAGSAVALLALLFSPFARRKFSCRWNYYSWAAALLLFLIPFALPVRSAAHTAAAIPEWTAAIPFAVPDFAAAAQASAISAIPWQTVFAAIWLAGTAALGIRYLVAAARFYRELKKACVPAEEPEIQNLFAACKKELQIRRSIPLSLCGKVSSPMLVGLFRPRIVLPDTALRPQEYRLVFLHELTHYRHADLFYKAAALVVCTLHWFNPLAWIVLKRVNLLCELACDESLVRGMEREERRNYGMAILNIMGDTRFAPPVSSAFSLQKEQLRQRLSRIMDGQKSTRLLVCAGVFAAALLLFVGVSVSSFVLADRDGEAVVIGGADGPTAVFTVSTKSEELPDELIGQVMASIKFDTEQGLIRYGLPAGADKIRAEKGWRIELVIAGRRAGGNYQEFLREKDLQGGSINFCTVDLHEMESCWTEITLYDRDGIFLVRAAVPWEPGQQSDPVPALKTFYDQLGASAGDTIRLTSGDGASGTMVLPDLDAVSDLPAAQSLLLQLTTAPVVELIGKTDGSVLAVRTNPKLEMETSRLRLPVPLPQNRAVSISITAIQNGKETAAETIQPEDADQWSPALAGKGRETVEIQLDGAPYKVYEVDFVQRSYLLTGDGSADTALPPDDGIYTGEALDISLQKPVDNAYVSAGFQSYHGHTGIDLAAEKGTEIRAVADGVVLTSKYSVYGYGNYLIIDHGNGIQTLYAQCDELAAEAGDKVEQGQLIATVGRTGNATGNHLHFELRCNGQYVDPTAYFI